MLHRSNTYQTESFQTVRDEKRPILYYISRVHFFIIFLFSFEQKNPSSIEFVNDNGIFFGSNNFFYQDLVTLPSFKKQYYDRTILSSFGWLKSFANYFYALLKV
jgi:hypothetical protein